MKKIIIKMITIVAAFVLGIVVTSFFFNKGNLDMTARMPEASLPVLYMEEEGQYRNPSFGYTGEIDVACLRSPIIPLDGDRVVHIALEQYNADIQSVSYEVRSTDMERLIQNGTVEQPEKNGQYWKGSLKVKDLLEDGEEYALIFRVELENGNEAQYFARVRNGSSDLVSACRDFALDFHNATLDKQNDYPLTQYLERDTSQKDQSLAHVTIHSKYQNVIWGNMQVEETVGPVVTYLELEDDAMALKLDYGVKNSAADGGENYRVTDYFRVRRTEARMYLLDYERTAERIFTEDEKVFGEQSIDFGILKEAVPYRVNEEGSVVNFVASGELYSYDIAQNKLSKVFSFQNGSDKRGLHKEFTIRLINMEDSGSMDFAVTGYMNRGLHEGRTGMMLMRYDSLTKTVEELLFIESSECGGVLQNTVGELLYVSYDDKMYLSYGQEIYAIDLNTKNAEILTENVSAENCLISSEGDMIAWQHGEDRFRSTVITTMDMKTGVRHTYTGGAGEYLRPLGFIGEDFIYGTVDEADMTEDFAGNTLFPANRVTIADNKGQAVREFNYRDKNKYVLSAEVSDNRIDLKCVSKNGDGTYAEALPEPITSNVEEKKSTVELNERKDENRQTEYVMTFETKAEGRRKKLTPKQVLFEDVRTISLETEEKRPEFHVYAKGGMYGVYPKLRDAVPAAFDQIGVVTDSDGNVVWKRGSRRTRAVLSLADGTAGMKGAADSTEAAVRTLLEVEGKYADVRAALDSGKSAYEILKQNSDGRPENFTGCTLPMMLYYINEGQNVMAMTDSRSAEIIVGYDAQNIFILEPQSGQVHKEGQKEAAERYAAAGNVFFATIL